MINFLSGGDHTDTISTLNYAFALFSVYYQI